MSDLIKCIVVMNKAEALNDSDEVCNKNVIAIEEDTGFIIAIACCRILCSGRTED